MHTVTIAEQSIIPESDFFKLIFTDPDSQITLVDKTPSDSDYAGLVVVAVFKISLKYVGISRPLASLEEAH